MAINLLPWREQQQQCRQRWLYYYIIAGILLVVLATVGWQINHHFVLNRQSRAIASLNTHLCQIANNYAMAVNLHKQQQIAVKRLTFLSKRTLANQQLLTILCHLGDAMSQEIYLTAIQKTGNNLLLTGKSLSHTELASWMQQVAALIKTSPATTEMAYTKDQSVVDFNISYEVAS